MSRYIPTRQPPGIGSWRPGSTALRRARREARIHARKLERCGLPERAAIWRRRARNG